MARIKITSQAELDALPKSFDEYTVLEFYIPKGSRIYVPFHRENSSVLAWENSSVVARENSSVVAWGNSSVEARENSSVEAWGNSSVVAWENSSVVAWENSSVVARGNSSVVARGNSSVEAWENSILRSLSDDSNITASHNSVIILQECKPSVKISGHATLVNTTQTKHTINTFNEMHGNGSDEIILFKSVRPDNNKDFYTNTIEYKVGATVSCPDFDPSTDRECGGGLHLSPSPGLALSYNKGRVLKCSVKLKDISVYPYNVTKVRCKKVTVLEEYQGRK